MSVIPIVIVKTTPLELYCEGIRILKKYDLFKRGALPFEIIFVRNFDPVHQYLGCSDLGPIVVPVRDPQHGFTPAGTAFELVGIIGRLAVAEVISFRSEDGCSEGSKRKRCKEKHREDERTDR